MKAKLIRVSPFMALLLFLAGCYPIGPEFVEDLDATYTVINDLSFDFDDPTRQTYYIADTIIVLTDPNASDTEIEINQAAILARVGSNMNQLGYTEVTNDNEANTSDYLILVSVVRTDNYFTTWWGGGWGGWGGWGWGGCCFFPPVVTTTNIRVGSILVDIVDSRSISSDDNILPEVWIGIGEGLFRGSQQNINTRLLESIDQMFKQSPYLQR